MDRQVGMEQRSFNRVADLLRSARGSRRQTDVADAIQVTQAGYSAWERGERVPKSTYWTRIERVLDLEPGSISRALYGPGRTTPFEDSTLGSDVDSDEDRQILATIGELTEDNRELVKSMLQAMLAQQRANRHK